MFRVSRGGSREGNRCGTAGRFFCKKRGWGLLRDGFDFVRRVCVKRGGGGRGEESGHFMKAGKQEESWAMKRMGIRGC